MEFAIAGLGKMGSQIATKLLEGGQKVYVDSRHEEHTRPFVEAGAVSYKDYAELAKDIGAPFIFWLMIPNQYVPAEVDKLIDVLPRGSIIVDGGNSRYTSTIEQGKKAAVRGIAFVDVGTSGGIWGVKQGFSMMVGGEAAAINKLAPVLDLLARPNGGWFHFGNTGAGHFVKMVHNGIEYGIMEAYAEGYRLIKEGPFPDINLGRVAEVWQRGSINQSFLNGLIEVMLKRDPELEGVKGVVGESGEARWTLETADKLGIPTPVIKAAFNVRLKSQAGDVSYATKFLAQLRNEFGGHNVNPKR